MILKLLGAMLVGWVGVVCLFAIVPIWIGLFERIPKPRQWREFDYIRDYAEPVRKWASGGKP